MIRTNLSTKPFYNEGAVGMWILVLAILVAGATIFNVGSVIGYNRSDATLATEASTNETRAGDLRARAAKLRATVDPKQIERAATEARAANDLIDRRTFSWTELFNQFEATIPDDARITSVRPKLDQKRGIVLTVTLVARRVEDVDRFMLNLEGTGAFRELNPVEDKPDEAGLINATIEGIYKPASARAGATVAAQAPGAKKP